jgi:iron complex outermembrane recepter protein
VAKSHARRVAASTVAALTAAYALPAIAQEGVLQEVVVSAQKREQNIQDVGISMSAFTGDQLKAIGVQESYDVAAFSPGVFNSGNLAGQNTQFTIRGVTQNDFNDIVEAPIAVYLDEGYIAVAQAQTFALYDIDRVEVLNGPQGTLFGRNATGGLVQYISRKPSFDKLEGYTDVSFGEFDSDAHGLSERVEAAVSGPFSDKIAGRVAMLYNHSQGYLNNLYPYGAPTGLGALSSAPGAGANLGGDDTFALRGTLDIKPTDDLLVRLSANYAHSKEPTGPYQSKSTIVVANQAGEITNVINTPANETRLSIQGAGDGGGNAIDGSVLEPGAGIGLTARPVPGGDFFGYVDPDGPGTNTSSDFAFNNNGFVQSYGLNAHIEWNLGGGTTVTSITDFKDYKKLLFIDVDAAPVNQLANYAGVNASSKTEELRINGEAEHLRWVTGLFYLSIKNHSNNGLKAPQNSIIGDFIRPVDIGTVADLTTNSYSVFGQVEYDFTPKLTGILGLRAIQEEKSYDTAIGVYPSNSSFTANQGTLLPSPFGEGSPYFASDSTSNTLWAGKAQLDYRITDRTMVYGGVNRGVKAGSFNAPLLGAYLGSGGNASLPYKAETLYAYEAGVKSTFWDGRARFNSSVFYYDYRNYQAFLFVGVGGVVINADSHSVGSEMQLQVSPAKGLDVIVGASWLNAIVDNIPLRYGSPLPPRDVKPTYAPPVQANLMLRYEWPWFGGLVHVLGGAHYSDSFYYNLRNFSADQFASYTMVNAGTGWASNDDKWEVNVDVKNLTNAHAGVQGFDLATLCGCNEVAYQPPRWIGINVKARF